MMYLYLWNTWIDNESSQIEEVDFGNKIYYFLPFSSFCECVCVCFCVRFYLYSFAFTICPRVLSVHFLFFVFFFLLKIFFLLFLIIVFYFFILITLFYFILFLFFLSILSPFYSEPCGWKALGVPARRQGCASGVGEPTSGHCSTRHLPAPRNIKR